MLIYGNYFFVAVYTTEAFMKVLAMSPRYYFGMVSAASTNVSSYNSYVLNLLS